jgi:nicotinate-nucleotide pyrophosphorylase (carboxylating)
VEGLSEAVQRQIADALNEDVGAGDWTTEWTVDVATRADAVIVAKTAGVIAGTAVVREVYRQVGDVAVESVSADGEEVAPGALVSRITGSARRVLTGERIALNFLGHLSGVATLTRRYVDAVEGTGARITDTRKTTPLWRELERLATRAGGAVNHRRGLDAMVLIKENHLVSAGGIEVAVRRVNESNQAGLRVEVETTSLDEVEVALACGVDRIMLDNMPLETLRAAVELIRGHARGPEIEASGGITLQNVRAVAETGVDFISVGALTHSAPALDLSLQVREPRPDDVR